MKFIKTIQEEIKKKIRLIFLKRKIFFGSYSDNIFEMKKFFADRNIIVVYIQNDSLKPITLKPEGVNNIEEIEIITKEQKRQFNRNLRKKHKAVLWYVEDHFLTRYIGWKPGRENLALMN